MPRKSTSRPTRIAQDQRRSEPVERQLVRLGIPPRMGYALSLPSLMPHKRARPASILSGEKGNRSLSEGPGRGTPFLARLGPPKTIDEAGLFCVCESRLSHRPPIFFLQIRQTASCVSSMPCCASRPCPHCLAGDDQHDEVYIW